MSSPFESYDDLEDADERLQAADPAEHSALPRARQRLRCGGRGKSPPLKPQFPRYRNAPYRLLSACYMRQSACPRILRDAALKPRPGPWWRSPP